MLGFAINYKVMHLLMPEWEWLVDENSSRQNFLIDGRSLHFCINWIHRFNKHEIHAIAVEYGITHIL